MNLSYWQEKVGRYRTLPIIQQAAIFATKIIDSVFTPWDTFCARILLAFWGARCEKKLTVAGKLRCYNYGILMIGSRVSINGGPRRNFVAGDRVTALGVGRGAKLHIGSSVGISGATIICQKSIHIGDNVMIGGGCDIYDSDFHQHDSAARILGAGPILSAEILIGPGAFIGAHTIILKGSQIGEGAFIGAGSIVTSKVPPFEIWAGRPAKFIRKLSHNSMETNQ